MSRYSWLYQDAHHAKSSPVTARCCGCGLTPSEIDEYVDLAQEYGLTPEETVRAEEGTYNHANGHFWCTECYIKAGTPVGVAP